MNQEVPEHPNGDRRALTARSRTSLITPNEWLDDSVVATVFNLIEMRSGTVKVLPPMVYDKLVRGITPWKVFSTEDFCGKLLVIPCVTNKHWSLAVHRPGATELEWFNSINGYPVDTKCLVNWVGTRCAPTKIDSVIWPPTPQQQNGDDCGVIVCLVAIAVALDREMRPSWGAHIDAARLWIDDCLTNQVIPDHPVFNAKQSEAIPMVPRTPGSKTVIPSPVPVALEVSTSTPVVQTFADPLQEEAGDEEDDEEQQLDTFITDVESGRVPRSAPPPTIRKMDRRDPVITRSGAPPPHQQATQDQTSGCHVCQRPAYKHIWCRLCKRACHARCATFGRCNECHTMQAQKQAPNKAGAANTDPDTHTNKVSGDTGTVLKEKVHNVVKGTTTIVEAPTKEPAKTPMDVPKAGIHNRTKRKASEVHIHVTTKGTSDFQDGRKGPCPTVTHAAQFLSMKVAETPQESMDMAWKGIGAAQRASHQRLLRLLQITMASHFDLLHLPVAMASIKVLVRVRAALKWSPVTMAKHAASLSGAMARLDQYMDGPQTPIRLSEFSVWTDFMKEVKRQERLHKGRVPVAAKWPEVKRIMDSLLDKGKRATAILLLLSWTHAARPGDVWRLLRQDLELTPTRVTITWRRGKVVTTRGPYTTFAVPGMYQQLLEEHINQVPHDKPIFEGVWRSQNFLKEVRMHNPALELKSLRRGALQALSEAGVSEEILMIFSGHASVDTLRRYLGYRPSEDVARRCEEAARLLIQ